MSQSMLFTIQKMEAWLWKKGIKVIRTIKLQQVQYFPEIEKNSEPSILSGLCTDNKHMGHNLKLKNMLHLWVHQKQSNLPSQWDWSNRKQLTKHFTGFIPRYQGSRKISKLHTKAGAESGCSAARVSKQKNSLSLSTVEDTDKEGDDEGATQGDIRSRKPGGSRDRC